MATEKTDTVLCCLIGFYKDLIASLVKCTAVVEL